MPKNTPAVEPIEVAPEPEKPVLGYEILERNGTSLTVKFINPDWVGDFVEEEFETEEDGEMVKKTHTVDRDPNLHVTKSINVPLNADGTANRDTLRQILIDQARGVKNRMDAAATQRIAPVDKDLDKLIGASL